MPENVPFEEQAQVIADTLPDTLQTHLLGQEVDDGLWVNQGTEDAARIKVVAGLIFALKVTYSNYGIENWFERPHQQLGGKAPKDFLHGDWNEFDPNVQVIIRRALFHARCGQSGPTNDPGLH